MLLFIVWLCVVHYPLNIRIAVNNISSTSSPTAGTRTGLSTKLCSTHPSRVHHLSITRREMMIDIVVVTAVIKRRVLVGQVVPESSTSNVGHQSVKLTANLSNDSLAHTHDIISRRKSRGRNGRSSSLQGNVSARRLRRRDRRRRRMAQSRSLVRVRDALVTLQ